MSILTTELEAVNAILGVAGDSPVSSLTTGYQQADIARTILHAMSKSIQSRGLWFNEDDSKEIAPTVTGEILIPANTLKIEIADDTGYYIQRGNRIYDRSNHTYTINTTLTADIVEFLDWDLTPQSFREFVITLSKEQYNDEHYGSSDVVRALEKEKIRTQVAFEAENIDGRDLNMLNNTRSSSIAFLNRR